MDDEPDRSHDHLRTVRQSFDRQLEQPPSELEAKTEALAREMALRTRAEEALADRESIIRRLRQQFDRDALASQRLASGIESIKDGFALFDRDDLLVLCNSAYRTLIGASAFLPLAGASYGQLLDAWLSGGEFPDEAARAAFRADRLERGGHDQATTFDLRMRDGRNLRVADRRTARGEIVETISDVTQDVHLAEAPREAQSELLSSMTRKLRSQLNAVLGFAQLMQRDKRDPLSDRHQYRAGQIFEGGGDLLRLIDDIEVALLAPK